MEKYIFKLNWFDGTYIFNKVVSCVPDLKISCYPHFLEIYLNYRHTADASNEKNSP
jgi:hypothetical protein